MTSSRTLPTIRRVLAVKRRGLRTLQAELGQSTSRLSEIEATRQALAAARSALFASGAGLSLELLRLTEIDRNWQSLLRRQRNAEHEREHLENSLARMRAEIRALEIYADRLAAGPR